MLTRPCWQVQCDTCSKWRQLPPGFPAANLGPVWTCAMHPWPSQRSCNLAQSNLAYAPITQLAGKANTPEVV